MYKKINNNGEETMIVRSLKSAIILIVGLILITLWMNTLKAHADVAKDTADGFYTVAFDGSTDYVGEFALDGDKPWLYINIVSDPVLNGLAISWWDEPGNVQQELVYDGSVNANQVWLALDDATWDSIKQVGAWKVDGSYSVVTNNFDVLQEKGTANFTVTPEPISSVLFLVGGAGLVARRFRK
jgi:hypothetical protein